MEVLLADMNSSLKPVMELGHDCHGTQKDPNEVAKVQQEAAVFPSVVLSSVTKSASCFIGTVYSNGHTDMNGSTSESGLNKLPEQGHQRPGGPLPELLEEVIVDQEATALEKKDQ